MFGTVPQQSYSARHEAVCREAYTLLKARPLDEVEDVVRVIRMSMAPSHKEAIREIVKLLCAQDQAYAAGLLAAIRRHAGSGPTERRPVLRRFAQG